MDILGALTVVKQTIDITKDLRNIDEKIDAATWKLRLSDLIDKLVETKDALIDAREREIELRAELANLKGQLANRNKYHDDGGLLFELGDGGVRLGEPYCNLCHVKEDKFYRMRHHEAAVGRFAHYRCDNCNTPIKTGPSLPRPPADRHRTNFF